MKSNAARLLLALWIVTFVLGVGAFKKYQDLRSAKIELERLQNEASFKPFMPSNPTASPQSPEPALSHPEKMELMRLRNEVTQLRTASQAAADAQAEIARLKQENQEIRAGRNTTLPATPMEKIVRDQWSFKGFATPQDAYVSGMWAMKEGRVQTLLETLSPEERQRFETLNAGKSEEEILARFKKEFGAVTAFRVAREEQVSPTEVILDVEMDRAQAVTKRVRMNNINGEWKAGGPVNQNADGESYDPLAFYRKNPELMRRYFPHLVKEGSGQSEAQAAQSQ